VLAVCFRLSKGLFSTCPKVHSGPARQLVPWPHTIQIPNREPPNPRTPEPLRLTRYSNQGCFVDPRKASGYVSFQDTLTLPFVSGRD
jgi:hypothetical protein